MRAVPKHVDTKARLIEYMFIFGGVFFLLHTFFPIGALIAGILVTFLYAKVTIGKPEGYLLHLIYRAKIDVSPLISKKIRRLSP